MLLENEHIRLRAIEPDDLELLYQWENNPRYWYAGDVRTPYSKYVLKQFILDAGKDLYETKQLRLIIESKDNNTTVGAIDLFDFDPFNSRAAVGIMIDETYQQQGNAGEALALIKEYAFDYLKINQLYAHVAENNTASRKLFEGQNFEKTGVLKQWIRDGEGFSDILVYQSTPNP